MRFPDRLRTPQAVVLADRLERNLAQMAAFASGSGIELRPHAKTHKCVEIARRQIELGASGISVATVGEGEALCRRSHSGPGSNFGDGPGRLDDVFIAYPLWPAEDLLDRLRALASFRDGVKLTVGVDSTESAHLLSDLAGVVDVMVEVDCGLRRTGVYPDPPDQLLAVGRAVQHSGLHLKGVFTFPGHSYLPGGQAAAAQDEADALVQAAQVLMAGGLAEPGRGLERSGGSTPSAHHSVASALTEMRPGVYVFNDAQQVELGVASLDQVALVIAATVVSRPRPDRIVLDAGSKALGPDRPVWTSGHGRLLDWPEARVTGLWEHHAVVSFQGVDEPPPGMGEVVAVVPNHVCTAVNLTPELLVVDGALHGNIVDTWVVAAMGANR